MAQQIIDIGLSPNDGTGDPLRTGGQKINANFSEIYPLLNNRVQVNPVTISDWTQPISPQIQQYINDHGLAVPKDVVKILVLYKASPNGSYSSYYYLWTAGEGLYGTAVGNTINGFPWFLISIVSGVSQTQYDLGEIGATPIEDAVNNSGPYQVSTSEPTLFITMRSGEEHVYLYVGTDSIIGIGEAQTTASDFVDLTEEPQPPIDPNDYVTYLAFNGSLYDTAETGFSAALADFTSLTEKFYFLKTTGDGKLHFASKETNIEDFVGSRIYNSATSKKHDLGQPTVTQNGYHFWDLGVQPVVIDSTTPNWDFQAWFDIGASAASLDFDDAQEFQLDLKDTNGDVMSSVLFGFQNIQGLQTALDDKLTNTAEANKVAMKDDSGVEAVIFKEFDEGTTAYATTAALNTAGYTTANGYVQGFELVMRNTGTYTRYEKMSDDDNDWYYFTNANGWQPLPLV